jgi:glycosyltransferase involved in cell wall biosynthesis
MSRNASVAVVIPAYNHEAFVDEAVQSALAQDMPVRELVIVEDGSRDGTRARCDEWARRDARVRVIHQANSGSHAAINRGVEATRSDVVMILNSDDRWAKTRVSRVTEAMQDARVGFVLTGARLIDEEGRQITDAQHWWQRTQHDFRAKAVQWGPVHGLLYGNYSVSTSNFVFRRRLWDRVGPMRPRQMIPDWDWAVRAALLDPDGLRWLADEYLLDYRLHGGNAILSKMVRGDLEVGRLHRWMLKRLGVLPGAVDAVFRNQRDLRRQAWRLGWERGEDLRQDLTQQLNETEAFVRKRESDVQVLQSRIAQAETFVHQREADVAALQQRLATTETFVHQREADVAALQQRLATTETFVHQREADVRTVTAQAATIEGFLRAREADVQALQEQVATLEALRDEAESSWTWRHVRKWRRRWGWQSL